MPRNFYIAEIIDVFIKNYSSLLWRTYLATAYCSRRIPWRTAFRIAVLTLRRYLSDLQEGHGSLVRLGIILDGKFVPALCYRNNLAANIVYAQLRAKHELHAARICMD